MINIPQDMSNGTLTGRLKSNSVDYHTPFNNLIESTLDDRKTNLYTFLGIPYLRKYSNTAMNITVIRLAEIYLNRAECKVHLGYSDTEVRDDYNIIRLRANNVVDSISSGAENLLSAIHTERWIELGFEGDRYHDLKRRKEKFNTFKKELNDFFLEIKNYKDKLFNITDVISSKNYPIASFDENGMPHNVNPKYEKIVMTLS